MITKVVLQNYASLKAKYKPHEQMKVSSLQLHISKHNELSNITNKSHEFEFERNYGKYMGNTKWLIKSFIEEF